MSTHLLGRPGRARQSGRRLTRRLRHRADAIRAAQRRRNAALSRRLRKIRHRTHAFAVRTRTRVRSTLRHLAKQRPKGVQLWRSIGPAAAVVLLGIVLFAIPRLDREPSDRTSVRIERAGDPGPGHATAARVVPDRLPGLEVRVNERAGYLFSYPDRWELSTTGSIDELVSPAGDVVMTFEVAPRGPLARSSDRFLEALTAGYAQVEIVSQEHERTEQGHPAILTGITATDAGGNPVRLLAIAVRGPEGNRAITVRLPSGSSEPPGALQTIQEIVGSFRTSPGSTGGD